MTLYEQMRTWRHDLHKHPELGFQEVRTSNMVANLLEDFGLEVHRDIGTTGIVGILKNGNSKRTIGLRADMDALPIQEANNFAHRSVYNNVFHGCGHDGHTAMLLGAAKQLSEYTDLDGTVYFIFQPSEENGLGAMAMINEGLFERFPMDSIYGMHNMPGIPAGHFAVRKGAIMASEDIFVITIQGRGGHSSMPDLAIDPIAIGAEIVLEIPKIISLPPKQMGWGVISVTEFVTDGARNVIPSSVTIKGDCRTFDVATQDYIEDGIRELVNKICETYSAQGEVDYRREFIPTINTSKETEIALIAAKTVANESTVNPNCTTCPASEDFARMLQMKPGCYIFIGNGLDGNCGSSLHNPNYDLNDDILITGCNYWIALVMEQLLLS